MLKIGILEDETAQSDELIQFLTRYQSSHPDFCYTADIFDTGSKLIFGYRGGYDLLFMDIRLPDMLGIEAAKKIRQVDENVMIVFVTNLSQYAIDGYAVNAFDYILKPLLYGAFSAKMDRILNVLSHRKNSSYLTIRTKQETFHLDTDTVFFVEVSGHDLIFHTDRRDYSVWGTLAKYEDELKNRFFTRCNACYLVNLKYVQCVRGSTVTVNGTDLAVSRTRRKAFLSELAKYKGGSV